MKKRQIKTAIQVLRQQGLSGLARVLLQELANMNPPNADVNSPVGQTWTTYMDWLTFANAGMMNRGNAYCFDYAIKNLPSAAPIIEIGSFCGLSTNMITYMKEKYNVKNPLVTCDRWLFEGAEHGGMIGDSQSISHAEYREFVKETYTRNIRMFSRYDLPHTIEVFSDEFFDAWSTCERRKDIFGREITLGGSISFCYIDGNHSYEYARRDFENADKYLECGGFLLFDDSGDGSGWEVCKVVQEVMHTGRYDLIVKNPNYFFKKK